MTLDLGPIKERAGIGKPPTHDCRTNLDRCDRCDREAYRSAEDVPALVAEVEALRAALGAEREACDILAEKARDLAQCMSRGCERMTCGIANERNLCSEVEVHYARRRAPKIGGGE